MLTMRWMGENSFKCLFRSTSKSEEAVLDCCRQGNLSTNSLNGAGKLINAVIDWQIGEGPFYVPRRRRRPHPGCQVWHRLTIALTRTWYLPLLLLTTLWGTWRCSKSFIPSFWLLAIGIQETYIDRRWQRNRVATLQIALNWCIYCSRFLMVSILTV